jgi:hypothetical protein
VVVVDARERDEQRREHRRGERFAARAETRRRAGEGEAGQ